MHLDFGSKEYWRALILYGRNQSTYKLALGQSLLERAQDGQTNIRIDELAEQFFDLYTKRVENDKPQLFTPGRKTVVARAINKFIVGRYSRQEAINEIRKNAFGDVIPRFHNLRNLELPFKFYEKEGDELLLTDELLTLANEVDSDSLINETKSRWDMLEAAFAIKKKNYQLHNDIRRFYLMKGHERENITKHISLLNGYQEDVCFYCGEVMNKENIQVDHVIPRQLIQHDEVWNLVLVHELCNMDKLDAVPPEKYIEKLYLRNEHFIASDHPIKQTLTSQLGETRSKRKKFIKGRYEDAKRVIGYSWGEFRNYNIDADPLYHSLICALPGFSSQN